MFTRKTRSKQRGGVQKRNSSDLCHPTSGHMGFSAQCTQPHFGTCKVPRELLFVMVSWVFTTHKPYCKIFHMNTLFTRSNRSLHVYIVRHRHRTMYRCTFHLPGPLLPMLDDRMLSHEYTYAWENCCNNTRPHCKW